MNLNTTSGFLTKVFDNFEQVYGKKDNIRVEVKASDGLTFAISPEGTRLKTGIELKVVNPYHPEYEAVMLTCLAEADLDFKISKADNMLTAGLRNATMQVTDMHVLFYSEVTLEELNQVEKLEPLTTYLSTTLNELVNSGKLGL